MANCCCCRAAAIVAAIVLPGGKAGRLIVPLSFEAAEPIHCLQNYRSYWDIKTIRKSINARMSYCHGMNRGEQYLVLSLSLL